MNITEEDVRSELLDGWEIVEQENLIETSGCGYMKIQKNRMLRICFFYSGSSIDFSCPNEPYEEIAFTDFLSGNYDLSEISKHYSESEWSAIIGMCESIVRLITGEKQPEKPTREELPFNEWVHIIFQSHDIKQSDSEYEKTRFTQDDGFARIYAADLVIVIQPVEKVMHISTLNQVHTFTHSFLEWGDMESDTFPIPVDFSFWVDSLEPALFEIIETLGTPESTPEKSLEEKVREILTFAADFSELKVTDHSVEFLDNSKPPMWYYVKENEIGYAPADSPKSRNTFTVAEYQGNYGSIPEINAALPKIAALLDDQEDQPSPTYTELEQRVSELEEQLRQERENHIQQGSVEGQKRDVLEKRVAELEEQLQSSVSEADHERETGKLEDQLSLAMFHLDEAKRDLDRYRSWFEQEYAKNAESV